MTVKELVQYLTILSSRQRCYFLSDNIIDTGMVALMKDAILIWK